MGLFRKIFQPKKYAADQRKVQEAKDAADADAKAAAARSNAPTSAVTAQQVPVLIVPNPPSQPVMANIGLANVTEPPIPYKKKRTPNPVGRASGITYELISTDKVFTKEINLDTVAPVKALPYDRNTLGTIMLDLNKDLTNNKGMYNLYTPKFSQKKFNEVIDVAFEEFVQIDTANDLEYLQKLVISKTGQVIVLTDQQKKNAAALDDMRKKVLAAKAAEEAEAKAKRKAEADAMIANAAAARAREAEAAARAAEADAKAKEAIARAEAETQRSMRAGVKIEKAFSDAGKNIASTTKAAVKSVGSAVKSAGTSIKKFFRSDKVLKTEIQLVGQSPAGINIYQFQYKSDPLKRTYQGVIADELLDTEFADAVATDEAGYLAVDYSKIDVEFKDVSS